MSDDTSFLGQFTGDVREDDEHPHAGNAPSARWVDERDAPAPAPGPGPYTHELIDPVDTEYETGELERVHVIIPDEIRTFHAPARILAAQTATWAIGQHDRRLLGLEPSRVQAQTIAYCVVSVLAAGTDAVHLAPNLEALASMRFRVTSQLVLPGVAGVYLEAEAPGGGGVAAEVVASVLVVGR